MTNYAEAADGWATVQKLGAIAWGLSFIWTGIAFLENLGRGLKAPHASDHAGVVAALDL